MSQNFSDPNNNINVSAIALFQSAGTTDRFIDFGNIVQVAGNLGVKKQQAFFSLNGFLQLAKDVVVSVTPEFTLTCSEFPVQNLGILYGNTTKTAVLQSLSASATLTVTNIAPFDIVRIPVENPTIISVTVGAVASVLGVDYDLVGGGTKASAIRFRSGSAQVVGTTPAVITYSTPALTATAFPRIWKEDTFNNMNRSGYAELTFTDAYSGLFNHRITGNCFLSPTKIPDYKPDAFCQAEFQMSFVGAGNLYKVET